MYIIAQLPSELIFVNCGANSVAYLWATFLSIIYVIKSEGKMELSCSSVQKIPIKGLDLGREPLKQ